METAINLIVLIYFVILATSIWLAEKKPHLEGYPILAGQFISNLMFTAIFVLAYRSNFFPKPMQTNYQENIFYLAGHIICGWVLWIVWMFQLHPSFRKKSTSRHKILGFVYYTFSALLIWFTLNALASIPLDEHNRLLLSIINVIQISAFTFALVMSARALYYKNYFLHRIWICRNIATHLNAALLRLVVTAGLNITIDHVELRLWGFVISILCTQYFYFWYFEPRFIMNTRRNYGELKT